MQRALASAKNAATVMVARYLCGIMLLVAILVLRIDTVEVWGSSPHGPTINLLGLRADWPKIPTHNPAHSIVASSSGA
jgi:hypothetical protein